MKTRTVFAAIAAALAIVVASCTNGAPVTAVAGCPAPVAVAHRGASSQAPENTGVSAISAIRAGVKWIEMDLQYTRDNVPVLMHDGTVDRTTNGSYSGAVSSLYYSQLETLDAGSWFSGIYRGTRVPSFVTELKYVKPYAGVNVMPELKGAPTTSQLTTVSNAIKTYMPTRTVVQSFSSTNLTRFHAINPAVPLALTTDATPADPVAALRAARATYWLPNKAKITAAQVSAVKAAGIKVMPWTADSTVDWQTLSEWGVDGILSNKAVQYTGWAAARCGTDL